MEIPTKDNSQVTYSRLQWLLQKTIVLVMPAFILLTSLYFVTTEAFIYKEYQRLNFPKSEIFSPQERIHNSIQTLHYILNQLTLEELNDLGVYNDREINHLIDVQQVLHSAFIAQVIIGFLILLIFCLLLVKTSNHASLFQAVFQGGMLTVITSGVIGLVSHLNFDKFFITFHKLFFKGNSWLFPKKDSLIQLYPKIFWQDASFNLAEFSMGIAVAIVVTAYLLRNVGYLRKRI